MSATVRAQFGEMVTRRGGQVSTVTDLRAVAAYVQTLARGRAPRARVMIERGAYDAAGFADAADLDVRVLDPSAPPDPGDLRQALLDTEVGVGVIDRGVAETGQAVLYSAREWGRLLAFAPNIYVGVLRADAIGPDLADLIIRLSTAGWPPTITFVSGCSSSGDIENIPVMGVHGPLEFHVLLLEEGS